MTYSYQWFSAPKEISIVCPVCQKEALFQFASVFHVEKKQDRIFFETHPAFETTTVYDSYTYTHKFCVIFYPALKSNPELKNFLECHKSLDNSVSHLIKDKGVVFCPSCLIKRKHQLNWPQEAYYCIDYKGQLLWAFHRPAFVSIYDYIQAKIRDRHVAGHFIYLLHIPRHFLTQHARTEVSKKMRRLLLRV